jgi:hypothetical protein
MRAKGHRGYLSAYNKPLAENATKEQIKEEDAKKGLAGAISYCMIPSRDKQKHDMDPEPCVRGWEMQQDGTWSLAVNVLSYPLKSLNYLDSIIHITFKRLSNLIN